MIFDNINIYKLNIQNILIRRNIGIVQITKLKIIGILS